jgi:glycosyltransferase involved in cell wall biosynthesis
LPEAYSILTKKEKKGSGGWLEASAKELICSSGISLFVATASPLVQSMIVFQGSGIVYYVFPFDKSYSAQPYESFMKRLKDEINPDVVHVHGTEYPYGLAYMNVAGPEHVVISMQGVMTQIAEHYTDGLTKWQILSNITIRDLRLKTIFGEKKEYVKRGAIERETIIKAKNIMGRTSFDKSFVMSVNPNSRYYDCNESLRGTFYNKKWNYEACTPHTIFLSQSNYPVKGLHQFLLAVPKIMKRYPDIKVRIAGEDITKHKTKADIVKYSGYGSIIYHLIKKLGLQLCVSFTGLLNETEMMQEYLKANVFVCPSTCENSSNSIAEAQMLGVPCVASSRGGNPDMIPTKTCGFLYDFDDIDGLTKVVVEVFELAESFDGASAIDLAHKRHEKQVNLNRTLEIYNTIAGNEK